MRRLLAAALMLSVSEALAAPPTGPAEAIDGDDLAFGPIIVRIHGIDAPEIAQRCVEAGSGRWKCGEAAADRLAELVAGAEVTCEPLDRDAYGRIISRCWVDGVELGAELVGEGLAWAFVRYADDYVGIEARAREAGLCIWQAETEPAWVYREDRWGRAVAEAPSGCPIKGNIARDGIYQTPWSPWYGRTQIDEAKASAGSATRRRRSTAGWRPARSR
jgi:endonuclease YncB( thermonuclease family)